jgi:hypothetical protein
VVVPRHTDVWGSEATQGAEPVVGTEQGEAAAGGRGRSYSGEVVPCPVRSYGASQMTRQGMMFIEPCIATYPEWALPAGL